MQSRDHTWMVAAFGLAAVSLAGALMEYLSWPLGMSVFAPAAGAGVWLLRRQRQASVQAVPEKVEGGLRMVEKQLPAGKSKLPHGLRVTVSTEVGVSLGLRIVCNQTVAEVEALVQTGRGAAARQGVPAAVRESRQAWLFVVQNSPRQRELFLRADLFGTQPFEVVRVEQIRPGGRVALPEWRDLDAVSGTEPTAPPGDSAEGTGYEAGA